MSDQSRLSALSGQTSPQKPETERRSKLRTDTAPSYFVQEGRGGVRSQKVRKGYVRVGGATQNFRRDVSTISAICTSETRVHLRKKSPYSDCHDPLSLKNSVSQAVVAARVVQPRAPAVPLLRKMGMSLERYTKLIYQACVLSIRQRHCFPVIVRVWFQRHRNEPDN
jgi:hypothetical protein